MPRKKKTEIVPLTPIAPEQLAEVKKALDDPPEAKVDLLKPEPDPQRVYAYIDTQIQNIDDHRTILKQRLRILMGLIHIAEQEYNAMPGKETAYAYNCLVQVMMSLMKDIKADQVDLMQKMLTAVVQPMFKELIRVLTGEAQQVRDTLYQHIPEEFHTIIDSNVKSLIEGVGGKSATEYNRIVELLTKMFASGETKN